MTNLIGGFTRLAGKENMTTTKKVTAQTNKATGGRLVKLSASGDTITRVTSKTDMPFGIVIAPIGEFANLSLSQSVIFRGREIYVELDNAVVTLVAGTPAYLTDDATLTNVDDGGMVVGTWSSSSIIVQNGVKVALVKVG
jgi:hypothetical protein